MTHHALAGPVYPRRYFDHSPTWFAWNKLTAADIHALRSEPGFEGQHIYFHINHPIRFVRVVGLVVEIAAVGAGAKHTLISLDDGSGACVQMKVTSRGDNDGGGCGRDTHADPSHPSNTLVDSLDVHVRLGSTSVLVNKEPISVGTVLKVKACLERYRDAMQLRPERVWVVCDTNAEARAWMEVAEWKRDKLAKPWVLSKAEMDRIDNTVRAEAVESRLRARKKMAARARVEEKRRRHEEKREERRKREEAKMNDGALQRSGIVVAPWE